MLIKTKKEIIVHHKGTRMVRIEKINTDNKLEKFRLNFSRCANCNVTLYQENLK